MSITLSRLHRDEQLSSLKGKTSDLVIIGGGVLGAGIALDAVERGLHVVLIDKVDFGYGSSGKSSKLIHGGLNYFNKGDLKSSSEMLKERKVLHRIAPNLVRKERFVVPIYGNSPLSFFKTWYDLNLYEKGSELKHDEKKTMLRKSAILEEIPILEQNKLAGGALVTEYVTDDCRLAIELIKTAGQKTLHAFNYMQLKELRYE